MNLKETHLTSINAKINRTQIFLALLSGALLFLSFPKFGLGFIAWIAFVPLLMAMRNTSNVPKAMVMGFITGVSAFVGILYWIVFVTVNYGHLPVYLGITLMLILAGYLGIYIALFAAGIVYLRRNISLYLVVPFLWICLEWVKSNVFTGFPWANIGYSQYEYHLFIQIADLTGVAGLSFLVMLINATIYKIITERSKKAYAMAAVVFLGWGAVYAYGFYRIQSINDELNKAPEMQVSLIQGNIDQSIKWNENYQKETIDIYEKLSSAKVSKVPRLLVWPETAVPFNYQEKSDLQKRVTDISKKTNSWFVFGSMSYEPRGKLKDYYNSAYLLSPEGETRGKYDKVHLVPYGEYVPLRSVFPFISALAADMGDFTAGKGFYPLSMNGIKLGILICYEGVLSEAGRKYKQQNADLLVNITNDAWFGATSAPYQHFSMTIFRSIETRLYMVRAANTGISAIIDPTGRVVKKSGIFKNEEISGNIRIIKIPTVYAKYGDWLVYAGFLLLSVLLVMRFMGRKKHVD